MATFRQDINYGRSATVQVPKGAIPMGQFYAERDRKENLARNLQMAQAQADQYRKEAEKANSFSGMAKNFAKGLLPATAEVMIGAPAKFIASTAEVPEVIFKGGKTSQREYKLPGLKPFKSFQSDFANVADDVIEGRKGMGSAAWELAKVPLTGLEVAGLTKGAGMMAKSGGQFAKAPTLANAKAIGQDVSATFLPTKGSAEREAQRKLAALQMERMKASLNKERPQATPYVSGVKGAIEPTVTPVSPVVKSKAVEPIKTPQKEDSLMARARKAISEGKTEEEFLKGQGNSKEYITVYHRTNEPLDTFGKGGVYSKENRGEFFVSNKKNGQAEGYGKNVVELRVKKSDLEINDEFPGGEEHYTLPVQKVDNYLKTKSQLSALYKQAKETPKLQISKASDVTFQPQEARVLAGQPRERGFLSTMKESPNTAPEVVEGLQRIDGQYIPRSTDALSKMARSTVEADTLKAKDIVYNRADDEAVATGVELITHLQKKGRFDEAIEVADVMAKKLTELGRSVQAASIYSRLSPEAVVRSAVTQINKSNLANKTNIKLSPEKASELFDMAKLVEGAKGEEKLFLQHFLLEEMQRLIPSTKMDKFLTLWKASLLTNPSSHIANITGNTTMLVLENIKDIPAVFFDKVISAFTGKRSVTLPSFSAQRQGAIEGLSKAGKYIRTGIDMDNVASKFDYTPVLFSQTRLGKAAQAYTNTVFRSLGAGDKVGKGILFNKSMRELAIVDGLNRGLLGKALISHADNLVKSPTNDMLEIATKDAFEGTFMGENALADFVSSGKRALSKSPTGKLIAEFVMPFVKTPTNIAFKVAEYSPIGFVKGVLQAVRGKSQREIVQSLGRGTTGTGLMWLGYNLAERGEMTGTYPTDETTRNMWEAQGKQANSILIDGKWVNLDKISPIGNILAMGANIVSTKKNSDGLAETSFKTAGETAKGLTEMTFLQGVSGALGALQEPDRKAQSFISNAIGSLIPSIVGAGARTIDPVRRETGEGLFDPLKNRVPFLKNTLPEKRNVFGEEMQVEGNQFLSPFRISTNEEIPALREIERLRDLGLDVTLTKSKNKQTIGGTTVEFTPEELNELRKTTGGFLKTFLNSVLNDPRYQGLNAEERAKVLNKGIQYMRDIGKANSLKDNAIMQKIREGLDEKSAEKTLQRQTFYQNL